MISLCEEHVTTTSAYQIFEVFFCMLKLYSLLKSRKCGDRQYLERWVNLVISSLVGDILFVQNKMTNKLPPGDGAYSGIHQNILVEAVLRPHINVLVDKHTPVFLFMQAWSTFWKNSHIVIAGTVPDALHCTIGLWVRTGVTNACWIHLQLDWVPSSYFGNSGVSLMLQKHNQEENNF